MEVTKDLIEDIIQCPVCLKVTDSSYIHCVRGHHSCAYCVMEIKQCPMCNDNILPKVINHLVANDLSSRLGDIQVSIFEDIKSAIKSATTKSQQDQSVQTDLLITNSSVNTQTDETKLLVATKSVHTETYDFHRPNNSSWRKQIINKTHSYPCMICNNYFKTYEKLEEHVKENHEEDLEVQLNESILCIRKFVVEYYKLPWERDMIILTSSRLYCVHIFVRSNGQMKCFVRFIDRSYPSTHLSTDNETYYTIKLEAACKAVHEGKGKPHTAECKMEDMYDVCFQETEIRSVIKSEMSFAFTFSLCNYK